MAIIDHFFFYAYIRVSLRNYNMLPYEFFFTRYNNLRLVILLNVFRTSKLKITLRNMEARIEFFSRVRIICVVSPAIDIVPT